MAATVSGSKTLSNAPAPHLTASALTTLLATAPENLKVADLETLLDAASRVGGGTNKTKTIGALLS